MKNTSELADIEFKTRGQRYNELWKNERKCRLTSSVFGAVCKARNEKRLLSITANILNPKCLEYIPSIWHDINQEHAAIKEYEYTFKVKCKASGLHPDYQYLAASPDSLFGSSEKKVSGIICLPN